MFWIVLLFLCLVAIRSCRPLEHDESFSFDAENPVFVERVIDGDTLLLTGGTRIRLLGVDTPETKRSDGIGQPLADEATAFTRHHVEGRLVTLQFDRERRDRYHRILAYVYVDEWFLNEELIRAGYSRAETRFPFSSQMKGIFRAAEEIARAENRGIWKFDNQQN